MKQSKVAAKVIHIGAVSAAAASLALAAGAAQAAMGKCRDPWVTEVVTKVKNRAPYGEDERGECNIKLYGAQWANKGELEQQVRQAFASLDKAGLEWESNGNVLHDRKFFTRIDARNLWIGPQAQAEKKRWMIELPRGYVIPMDRKCAPGYSSAGAGANSGCVK